ncbi:hypothetical protein PCANC_17253 [Puccinia coronata f. sp. avenae]|uniref:Uncharacterized protein n=1 Tax=Puccinia coronata f. sp. avenae TaxID=200324 RepID=A0A2N5U5K2_9BASI|nr:hypothetical protein PCANC_17253 [Puccinia coronata f. sp. avenae]
MLDSMPDILCIPVTRLAFPDQLQIFPTRKSLAFQGSQLKTASKSTEDEQAAKQDAERVRQLQQLAEVASRHSASDQPSVHELSSSVISPSPARPISSANRYSEPSGSPIAPLLLSNYAAPETYSLTLMGLEEIDQLATEPIHPSTTPGGEVGLRSLEERSADSPDGWLYDDDTDSLLSPHERSAQGQRNVHRPVALHSDNRALFPQGG